MINFLKDVPLSSYSVFKIGGPAKYFCEVKNQEELTEALNWASENSTPFFILGAGSNILVSDEGFAGLVIKMGLQELKVAPTLGGQGRSGENRIFASSGVSMAKVVNFAIENNLAGFEWGIGIPGTIGGSVFGNAGCYGGEMSQVVEQVQLLENVMPRTECQFSYRNSIFSAKGGSASGGKKHPEWIILGATLNLKKGDPAESRAKVLEYTKKRSQTQDIGEKCAGCIFKNFTPTGASEPVLAAAYLIDKAGLKGKTVGKAMVSQKHANYIVNTGGASSLDVKNLIELIKNEVQKAHGVTLEEEIRFV